MFIECSILRRTPSPPFTQHTSFLNLEMRRTVVTLTAVLLVLQVSHPLQHTACLHRTVCLSGKQVGLHQITADIYWKLNPSCTRWVQPLSGGGVSTVWCIDAQHARKQVGLLVTVTHWPAAATWDAGHHSQLNELLAVFEQRSRFTAVSITIITTDTGETRAPKVGHEISDVINAPSYTYHEEWW